MKFKLLVMLLAASFILPTLGQEPSFLAEDTGNRYWIRTGVVYDVANGHENKLDVIYPHNATAAVPTVIYIHGGGWIWGDKAGAVLEVLPYLKMG
jgi:acetyl esterase/lipase